MAYKKIMGTADKNELWELNNSQHSQNTQSANSIILHRRYIREKERGCMFSATTSRCWNYLPLKLRTSQSVNTLNTLHKHFKLCQFREKIFISHNINNIIYL